MKILLIIAILAGMFFSIRFTRTAIERFGVRKGVGPYRITYISKTVTIAVIVLYLILIGNVSGLEYSQVSIFLSSVFAVIGVALFAQWSILSNITASLIIFFSFPYRVGDKIKVLDKDDDISGIIEEITLFHVYIRRDKELITYPNNLILQKGVIKNPEEKDADC
ncbi:mechanosensitive ion channel family protein [Marinomonas sp.]|nr:mechanosensitive ion channel family protein [Marinomonas sp.]MDB4837008.1 mechanosensitive ion channel family protein [Marinomonas sp.]